MSGSVNKSISQISNMQTKKAITPQIGVTAQLFHMVDGLADYFSARKSFTLSLWIMASLKV
jgi:hypothetical protein